MITACETAAARVRPRHGLLTSTPPLDSGPKCLRYLSKPASSAFRCHSSWLETTEQSLRTSMKLSHELSVWAHSNTNIYVALCSLQSHNLTSQNRKYSKYNVGSDIDVSAGHCSASRWPASPNWVRPPRTTSFETSQTVSLRAIYLTGLIKSFREEWKTVWWQTFPVQTFWWWAEVEQESCGNQSGHCLL